MNIVIMTPCWPQTGKPNGIATYYASIVPALRSLGHNVFIMTANGNFDDKYVYKLSFQPSIIEKINLNITEKFNNGYQTYYLGAKAIINTLKEIMKEHDIDIVQIEDSFGWHFLVQKSFNFPVVMRLHGPHFLNNFEKSLSKLSKNRLKREERAFLAAKFVTSPSKNVMQLTKEKYQKTWDREGVIPNITNIIDESLRWKLKKAKRYQLLFVGRFDNHKGADILIDSIEKVYKQFPEVKLIFIGPDRGLIRDGIKYDLPGYLNKFHSHWPTKDAIISLGTQDKETIAHYRRESHVTVVPSRYETFGNVALEALSFGCPLVSTDAGALPEIVINQDSGLLFESGNPDSLAEKIKTLFENDELCEKLSSKAHQRVVEHFSSEKIANDLINFFVSLQNQTSLK